MTVERGIGGIAELSVNQMRVDNTAGCLMRLVCVSVVCVCSARALPQRGVFLVPSSHVSIHVTNTYSGVFLRDGSAVAIYTAYHGKR